MGRDAAGAQQPESTEGIWGGDGIPLSVDPCFNRLSAAAVERVGEDWPARGVPPSVAGVTDPRSGELGKGPGVTISWSGEQSKSSPFPTPMEAKTTPVPASGLASWEAYCGGQGVLGVLCTKWGDISAAPGTPTIKDLPEIRAHPAFLEIDAVKRTFNGLID